MSLKPEYDIVPKQEVGKWYNELELDPGDVVWTLNQSSIPSSVCSQPCGVGQVKITQQVDIT